MGQEEPFGGAGAGLRERPGRACGFAVRAGTATPRPAPPPHIDRTAYSGAPYLRISGQRETDTPRRFAHHLPGRVAAGQNVDVGDRISSSSMVGRDAELGIVEAALTAAERGRPSLTVLAGEAG